MSYKSKFTSDSAAKSYDSIEYSAFSVSNLLWEVEKGILEKVISQLDYKNNIVHLDFACGTGRILSFIEPYTINSFGIDVSAEMLTYAHSRSPKSQLYCKDISSDKEIEGIYNLITAFRFLSNVDANKRIEILRSLHVRMNPESLLIINSHTNPFSYKIIFLVWHQLRRFLGVKIHASYLTKNQMIKILGDSGFDVLDIIGYGFIPGKLLRFIPWSFALATERYLYSKSFLRCFGVNQIAICKHSTK